MELRYTLKTPKKENSLIYLSVHTPNGRVYVSTGISVIVKYWNSETRRVTKGYGKADTINSILKNTENELQKEISLLSLNKEYLTTEIVRQILAVTLTSKKSSAILITPTQPLTFWQYFDEFLQRDRFTNNGLPLKPQSYAAYKQTYQRLKDFESVKRVKLDFLSFNEINIKKFVSFLYEKQNNNHLDTEKKGLTPNTVALTIRRLKTVLIDAIDNGYDVPLSYRKVKVPTVQTTEIALSENDLMKLYHLDLSKNKSYEIVRDLFLIGSYTALRFSDYRKVNQSNIRVWYEGKEANSYLTVTTEKTNQTVTIPVLPIVDEILKKYHGTLPKGFKNQPMNRYLKEICKLAEFNEPIKVTEYKQGQRVETQIPKHDMISTHTARRTGATLIYNLTKDIYLCMSLTGHKSEKQFKQYIRNNEMDNAQKLSHEFKEKGFGRIFDPNESGKSFLKVVSKIA